MFVKYLDQMRAIRERILDLRQDVRENKDGVFYNVELTIIVEDFNNLNILLNDDLKLYDQAIPYLDLRLLREYVNKGQLDKAEQLSNQWYTSTHELIEYYRELDYSRAVLYLENCVTVFHYPIYILLMLKDLKTLNAIAA